MSVITITGRPGYGKTLNMTNECRLNFKADNPVLKRLWTEKILHKPYIYQINDYSNYPILLKSSKKPLYYYNDFTEKEEKAHFNEETQKYELYDWKVRLFDMRIKYKFNETARFYIDEIQAMYDSMDYKEFPDCIAHFFQAHRHLEVNNIYCNSQSLSRIIKRVLVVSEVYYNIQSYIKIFGYSFCNYKITWDLAAGNETKNVNENIADIEYKTRIFKSKKVYRMYYTKYLKGLLDKAEKYKNEQWDSLIMKYEDIMHMFFPTDEEKKELQMERY
jgi:hypothetical protein